MTMSNKDDSQFANSPKISVIVPSFNQGEYIQKTLESIVLQDYSNYELIVIDGGSSDSTLDTLNKYNSYIHCLISEPDSGQSHALQKGFSLATGDIFCWLCSDDLFMPGCLSHVAQIFLGDPNLDLVYGDTAYLYPSGYIQRKPRINYRYSTMLRAFNIIAQPSSFFSASAYYRTGGIDVSFQYAMDYDLFLSMGSSVHWARTEKLLSLYRLHPVSKTVSDRERFAIEFRLVREKHLRRRLYFIDGLYFYWHTMIVVMAFWIDRRCLKLFYDNSKYRLDVDQS